jgi:hypothetical protein
MYLKGETVICKQMIWNVCDMKAIMKLLGVVGEVLPQYD